jgi:5-methylcytosine-specific restriction endonuclease McrA
MSFSNPRILPLSATFEHVIPGSLGGSDRMENLKLTHGICNRKRGSGPEWQKFRVKQMLDRWHDDGGSVVGCI